jgi:cytochrome c oxidase subunit 2
MMRIRKTVIALGLMAGLAAYGSSRLTRAEEDVKEIKITAQQFDFSPDRITLKKGQKVKLVLTSTDVAHAFVIIPLKVDTDIPPGKTTEVTLVPKKTGKFRAFCDHYCGTGHSAMKVTVVVE